ncbi:hypothetical protein NHX12_012741 [Muraenolepis orangiensis]|uniref:Uncharacterized protein n=1 Tax=Muraenolepis orangiensis TaxID=630683 RepID=A0A9Q0DDF6_9TELE|nr:hypothetical protein NHX12_012741 [Muraenolepis orangiensis]
MQQIGPNYYSPRDPLTVPQCRCYGKPSLCCPLLEEMEKNITGFYHRGPGEGQPHLWVPGLRGAGDFKLRQEGNLGWLRSSSSLEAVGCRPAGGPEPGPGAPEACQRPGHPTTAEPDVTVRRGRGAPAPPPSASLWSAEVCQAGPSSPVDWPVCSVEPAFIIPQSGDITKEHGRANEEVPKRLGLSPRLGLKIGTQLSW